MSEGPHRATGVTGRLRRRLVAAVQFWYAVAERAQIAEVTFLAAAVAYYAFLSLLPVLLLTLSVGTALGGEALADAIVVAAGDILTPTGRVLVQDALENAAGRTGATIVSVLLLIWSMLRVFRALDIAFLKVYGTEAPASLRDQIRDGTVAVFGVGLGLVVMFGVGAFLSAFNLDPVLDLLGILVLPTVLTVVFLPLFYVFPDTKLRIGDALPGTLFAAIGWTVLQAGFQIYAANAGQYQAYGVLGGVLLLVVWFYLAAIVLLLGAVVNVVLSGRANPPVRRVRASAAGAPNRGRIKSRAEIEGGFAASGDRQLQQSPGSQRNTTPMVPDDDDSHRGGNEQPQQTEDGSDRGDEDGSHRKERDGLARNEGERPVDSDVSVDNDESIDSDESVDSDDNGRFRSDGGRPTDDADDGSTRNDDEPSPHASDEDPRQENESPSGDESPIEDELLSQGRSPRSDESPSDEGSSVDGDEGVRGESGDNETAREEDIPSWKGGKSSRCEDDEPFRAEDGSSTAEDGSSTAADDSSTAADDSSQGDTGSYGGGGAARDDRETHDDEGVEPSGAPDITDLQQEVDRLRSELDEVERDVESRTVDRSDLESDLKRYVRKRMRRGHARGWGPYLVLLYGTILTLGGFYWLDGIYAIGAMIILGLSTLGLYVLFVLFGIGLNAADVPFRAVDAIRRRRK